MANYVKKIDGNKFKAIKILLNGGSTTKEAAGAMQVSATTISYIRNAETYEEYKNTVAARSRNKRNAAIKAQGKPHGVDPGKAVPQAQEVRQEIQVQEVRQVVTVQATRFMEEQMKRQTELLTVISQKLAAIIDDLYGTGTKAGE